MTPSRMTDNIVQRNRFGEELANLLNLFLEFLLNLVYRFARVCFVP